MYSEIKFSNLSVSIKKHHAKVGRPSRPESHDIHEFIATNILAIYVSFLISCAPTTWSTRQLNHHLFGVKTKPLTKKTPVIDGLGHLRARKSIPRLAFGQAISEGIQRAEKEPRFAGGLQILYHPYVHALSGQHNLSTLHTLLALLPWARTAKFIHATADGIGRTTRTAETEIEAISFAIQSMDDQSQRQRMHLDVISTALLLAQEAVVMADHQRLRCWQSWFKRGELLFADWNVGDKQARQALDRCKRPAKSY